MPPLNYQINNRVDLNNPFNETGYILVNTHNTNLTCINLLNYYVN